jgi:hypothetical protein
VDGQSFAHIGLHKTDAASDWLLIKNYTALVRKDNITCWHDFSINWGKKMLLVI